jgi:hypothetical protein
LLTFLGGQLCQGRRIRRRELKRLEHCSGISRDA